MKEFQTYLQNILRFLAASNYEHWASVFSRIHIRSSVLPSLRKEDIDAFLVGATMPRFVNRVSRLRSHH